MNKVFRSRFNSREESFFKVKFQKTDNVFKDKIDLNSTSKSEDIYYDEVIFYDGGGIDGYGY